MDFDVFAENGTLELFAIAKIKVRNSTRHRVPVYRSPSMITITVEPKKRSAPALKAAGQRWAKIFRALPPNQKQAIVVKMREGSRRYAVRRRAWIKVRYDALLAEAGITPEFLAAEAAAKAERAKRNHGGRRPGAGMKAGHQPPGARLTDKMQKVIKAEYAIDPDRARATYEYLIVGIRAARAARGL
jgi:hypothetical protein